MTTPANPPARRVMDLHAVLAEQADPDEYAKLTIPYEVGILGWPAVREAIAYGSTFTDVRHHPAGGLLTRRGYVTVRGPWRAVRRFAQLWGRLARDLG